MKAFLLLTFLILFGCNTTTLTQENPLVQLFSPTALKVEALKYNDRHGDIGIDMSKLPVISDTLLKKHLTPALIERISFTGSEATYFPDKRFALDNFRTGCILYTEDVWFRKTSMLVYDNRKKKFIDVVDIAQFYGGESGTESIVTWLYKSQSRVYMFSKNIGWSARPALDEKTGQQLDSVIETWTENNALFRWDASGGKFLPEIMEDSIGICSKFKHSQE